MYIHQQHLENLHRLIQPGKVVVIYGARRVGKTTLLNQFLKDRDQKALFVSGDDFFVREYLESQSIQVLKDFVGQHELLVIDEAQYIKQIGLNLKLIVDHIPQIKIIATGSSSFDLAKDIGEPLTGRKTTLKLFPLSQMEIGTTKKRLDTRANLESRLIYGSYPEIITNPDIRYRENYLREIVQSYLLKDILALEGIRHAEKIDRLLRLLAFQIGKEVSTNELGAQLSMSKNTVDKYLDLLAKTFVICKRQGFSRNLRKEISKSNRYYFIDNGIRNALINNFNPLTLRNDVGEIWENYLLSERQKRMEYSLAYSNSYFWRTYDQQEIDLVEERGGRLYAYEFKWQNRKKTKTPPAWNKSYPEAEFTVIDRMNYLNFISHS